MSKRKKMNVLLLAGKGHEDYQIIGSRKNRFDDKETLISDTIKYGLPFGFIGNIVNSLYVKKDLECIFSYRFERIKEILNVGGYDIELKETNYKENVNSFNHHQVRFLKSDK